MNAKAKVYIQKYLIIIRLRMPKKKNQMTDSTGMLFLVKSIELQETRMLHSSQIFQANSA